jgi:signal transduction histidine kinase
MIISFMLGILVMAELLALGSITWRNLNRIDSIKADITQGHELEELVIDLLNNPNMANGGHINQTQESSEIHRKISHFIGNRPNLATDTKILLDEIKPLLLNIEQGKPQDIAQVLLIARKILNLQGANEEKLLTQVYEDSNLELNFAVVIPIVVLLPAFLTGLVYFKRRILSPLRALEQLLKRLVDGEIQPIENRKDPLMQPLFSSYNRLIKRLAELEEEHLTYTQTLEREIRHATHALLEQSHSLARSERLAAVGELAASTAHELRNPLAGIQAALENICVECEDPEIVQRLRLVSGETKRLTLHLNDLLAYSKQQPESAKPVNISKLVGELMTLLKYQVNENIKLIYSIPPNLAAILPETEFRQALLNLMLNSVQELGKQGGTINLIVNKSADNLKVEISDSGHGFPDTLLKQGVRPFASYREHGTGLGLSMVLRFARSLGGQLNLKNDNQGHACAILILPVNA